MPHQVKSRDLYGVEYDVAVSELSWRPAAYAILVREGMILLVKLRDAYHLPGGGVDLGEAPEEGVIREVKEETGLIASNPRLEGSISGFFTFAPVEESDRRSHVQSLLLYYLCDFEGEISVEGQEANERANGLMPEWVTLADLDDIKVGSTVDWRSIVKKATIRIN